VAAQLNAGAKALDTAFDLTSLLGSYLPGILTGVDIGFLTALVISVALILVYMVLGGYIAVVYNDVIRAMIMMVGLVVLPVYGLVKVGGYEHLFDTLAALNPAYIDPLSIGAGALIGFLGIGLGSPGQPHIVIRYMSIDDPAKLRFSAIVGTIWNVVLACGAVCVGLIGRAVFHGTENLPDGDPETVYLVLSSDLFGPVLYGLLIGGVFAAILSTADSQLLVVASSFARDLYEKTLKEGLVINERKQLRLSRLVLLVSGIVATILAYVASDLIFWLVLFAWGGLGASFGTALICSLYWKRSHKQGIIAGMITGTLVTILWKLYLKTPTGIYELIPAFVCSLIAIIIFSILKENRTST
jgi:sodium/proline symporter